MSRKDITIWTSKPDYEEYRQVMEEDLPWANECERRAVFDSANRASLSTQRDEMSVSLGAPIIIYSEYAWGGIKVSGFDMIKSGNLADCFWVPEDCDSIRWFVDEFGDLRSEESGGGLSVKRVYRLAVGAALGDTVDYSSVATVRLGDALGRIYGFEFSEQAAAGN